MTPFNIFLILLALVALVWGFVSGFVRQLGSIAGIVLGVIACRIWGDEAVAWLAGVFSPDTSHVLTVTLAYVGLFLLVFIFARVVGLFASKTLKALKLGVVDRLAGAVFKLLLWMFLLSLLLNLWQAIAPTYSPRGVWAERVEWLAPAVLGSDTASELMHAITPDF